MFHAETRRSRRLKQPFSASSAAPREPYPFAKTTGGLLAARSIAANAIEPTARRRNRPATALLRRRRRFRRGGGLRGWAGRGRVRPSRGRPRGRRACPFLPG